MNNLPTEVNKLLRSWRSQIEKNENLHRGKAIRFRNLYYGLGVPGTILAGLFTASSLAGIPQCTGTFFVLCIVQSILGAIVTGLFGVQTYMQLMSRFFNHKLASDRYLALLHTIETVLGTTSSEDPATILTNIQRVYDDIITTSPIIPANKILKYSVFDRETRSKSKKEVVLKKSAEMDIETGCPPASKEELKKVNDYDTDDEEAEPCIDVDLAERMTQYYIDPELQYQLDRFNAAE